MRQLVIVLSVLIIIAYSLKCLVTLTREKFDLKIIYRLFHQVTKMGNGIILHELINRE